MSALLAMSGAKAAVLFGLALTGTLFLALGVFVFVLVRRSPTHDPYAQPFGDVALPPKRKGHP